MPTCKEQILSEDYADFIVEIGFEEEQLGSSLGSDCLQNTYYKYDIIHASLADSLPLSLERYPYAAIPKLYGLMDSSAAEATGAIRLQQLAGFQLTGKNVIVGFVDTGIDYTHPAFLQNGQTRILSIWDQTIQTGTPPDGFLYGSEYDRSLINQALRSETPFDIVPSTDTDGHGTFLAGVACGSEDIENDFIGTANESTIAIVKLKPAKQYLRDYFLIQSPEGTAVYQETDLMLGVSYLIRLAQREQKPLVICLGVGSASGERAGGSAFSQMLNYYGELIGNCVVVCAGNEGNERLHYLGSLKDREYEDVELRVGSNTAGFVMELWGNIPDIISVAFLSPSGEFIQRIPARIGTTTTVSFLLDATTINVHYSLVEGRSGMELILLRFHTPTPGVWTLRIYGSNVLNGSYNIWMPLRQFVPEDTYFLRPDPDVTIDTPAATDSVITVAAYDHTNGSLYTNSGRGFTRTNSIKPDITAPGVSVFGPGISIFGEARYVTRSGTSISAALVAGNCAQLLEWGIVGGNIPQMRTNYIKNFLILGAIRDRNITYPSRSWGYGKVNLYESFRILTQG